MYREWDYKKSIEPRSTIMETQFAITRQRTAIQILTTWVNYGITRVSVSSTFNHLRRYSFAGIRDIVISLQSIAAASRCEPFQLRLPRENRNEFSRGHFAELKNQLTVITVPWCQFKAALWRTEARHSRLEDACERSSVFHEYLLADGKICPEECQERDIA